MPSEFKLDKLLVWYMDVKRFQTDKMKALMEKIRDVYAAKLPNEIYGVYTNELASTSDGKDMAIVWFFGESSWMGKDLEFAKHFDAHYGDGSFEKFLKDFGDYC